MSRLGEVRRAGRSSGQAGCLVRRWSGQESSGQARARIAGGRGPSSSRSPTPMRWNIWYRYGGSRSITCVCVSNVVRQGGPSGAAGTGTRGHAPASQGGPLPAGTWGVRRGNLLFTTPPQVGNVTTRSIRAHRAERDPATLDPAPKDWLPVARPTPSRLSENDFQISYSIQSETAIKKRWPRRSGREHRAGCASRAAPRCRPRCRHGAAARD